MNKQICACGPDMCNCSATLARRPAPELYKALIALRNAIAAMSRERGISATTTDADLALAAADIAIAKAMAAPPAGETAIPVLPESLGCFERECENLIRSIPADDPLADHDTRQFAQRALLLVREYAAFRAKHLAPDPAGGTALSSFHAEKLAGETVADPILSAIVSEISRAATKFPTWPVRGIDAAAVVAEESGELQQAALQATYEGGSVEAVRKEAIQTAAMAIQFLLNLSVTEFSRCEQIPKAVLRSREGEATPSAQTSGFSEWWVCFRCWKAYHVPTTGYYGKCQDCGHDTVRWPTDPNETLRLIEWRRPRSAAPAPPTGETARERIAQQLALWIQQGYTPMGETPLDDYGAEVLREVIVWLRSREGE